MDPYKDNGEKKEGDEVVLLIPSEETIDSCNNLKNEPGCEQSSNCKPQPQLPEIALFPLPSPGKPPRPPLIRRKSTPRPTFSRSRSRFEEKPPPLIIPSRDTLNIGPPSTKSSARYTPRTPIEDIEEEEEEEVEEEEEEEDDIFKREASLDSPVRKRKYRVRNGIEWLILVSAIACCVASVLLQKLQGFHFWGLEIWRWCLMVAVVCCGRLVTNWFVTLLVFSIERNYLFKKKVLYFVYGLKHSVQVFLWLVLILISWSFVFNLGGDRLDKTGKALFFVSRLIISLLIGSVIWLLKTLLVKMLASSFHMNRFFDRIQESIFHQYVLQMLSGPPLMELAEKVGAVAHAGQVGPVPNSGRLSFRSGQMSFRSNVKGKGKEKEEVIDVSNLCRMKQEKVSAWTMKGLVHVISTSGLSTISNTIDESVRKRGQREITSEWEARAAAYRIFKNVAKPGSKYIEVEDLMRFLTREELELVLPSFEGAVETGKMKKRALRNFVVKSYLDRRSLAHSLNDTKTAVNQLHKIATCIVILAVLIITVILTGIATTQVLLFISSQLLLVVFMFGNSAKTVFEAIIFVFVMHPFDVGDRCVVDGVMMVVEEMNILTTVMLKFDNEKIYYPNSVLATKPISNYYRSPDMWDSIFFNIGIATSFETIGALKSRIKMYLEGNPDRWHPLHNLVVNGITDVNKINMVLYAYHTMNFQNIGEKYTRRTDLYLELKRIFEDLSIKYTLLPQDVNLSYTGPTPLPMAITRSLDLHCQ